MLQHRKLWVRASLRCNIIRFCWREQKKKKRKIPKIGFVVFGCFVVMLRASSLQRGTRWKDTSFAGLAGYNNHKYMWPAKKSQPRSHAARIETRKSFSAATREPLSWLRPTASRPRPWPRPPAMVSFCPPHPLNDGAKKFASLSHHRQMDGWSANMANLSRPK